MPKVNVVLADKIDDLFRSIHPQDRGPYSAEEVAASLVKRGGPTISGTYIWQLRTGQRDNPTKKHLEALAAFFGVPVAYFFDDESTAALRAELESLSSVRDSGAADLAVRLSGLSDPSMAAVAKVVEALQGRSRSRGSVKSP